MAHKADCLPWKLVADNLSFASFSEEHGGLTNLFPSCVPDTLTTNVLLLALSFEEQINAGVFKVESSMQAEGGVQPFKAGEEVITPAIAKRIQHTQDYYRRNLYHGVCPPVIENANKLEFWTRNMTDIMWTQRQRQASNMSYRAEAVELLKTLLLHVEPHTVLRLAASPLLASQFRNFYVILRAKHLWRHLMSLTLKIYVCLNILYCKPELRDSSHGDETIKDASEQQQPQTFIYEPKRTDYRETRAYQHVVVAAASHSEYDVHKLPHRELFSFPQNGYNLTQAPGGDLIPGELPFNTLRMKLSAGTVPYYLPHANDIPLVHELFRLKGVPVELAINILEFADYRPKRRLLIALDPFDSRNRSDLLEYLEYCWQLLIRCSALASRCNIKINWNDEMQLIINDLFRK